jgi:hypothetical protein
MANVYILMRSNTKKNSISELGNIISYFIIYYFYFFIFSILFKVDRFI